MGEFRFQATDATRGERIILRASLCGPSGSGKTWTGLMLGTLLVERMGLGPLFVIDSENRSALRYAYSPRTGRGYRFKHVELPPGDCSPQTYMRAIDYCEAQGAGVILIDSFSHAWAGLNGTLQQVDDAPGASKFSSGWKKMTPIYASLVDRLQNTEAHVLFTLRAKMAYEVMENERGKKEPRKLGLAPVAREGIEYEGDIAFEMTVPDNDLIVGKSRCDLLAPGHVIHKPGAPLAETLIEWLLDVDPASPPAPPDPEPPRPQRPAAPKPDASIVDPLLLRLKGADNDAIRAVWDEADAAEGITPNGRAFVRAAAITQWTAIAESLADCDWIARIIKEQGFPAAAERRLLDALNVKARTLDDGDPDQGPDDARDLGQHD